MPKPNRVFDPMTGKPDRKASKPGTFPLYEWGEKSLIPDERIEHVLGFSEHRISSLNGNVESLSIRGTRIA